MAIPDDSPLDRMPPAELKTRRELGEAMMTFVQKITATGTPGPAVMGGRDREIIYDDAVRESITETYRLAVEKAAAQGIEIALCWHTLAIWTNEGRERIGYFSRALDCLDSQRDAHLQPSTEQAELTHLHLRADSLYEIGRVHAYEGDPAVARTFLLRAQALVQEASRQHPHNPQMEENHLEGKIAELLLQLPGEDELPVG